MGYKFSPKFTFPDVMNDFADSGKKDSMIHPEMDIINTRDFARKIEKSFKVIENSSANFEQNKSKISRMILGLMQNFHIFWNYHR